MKSGPWNYRKECQESLRACPGRNSTCQAPWHNLDHGELDNGFCCAGRMFDIAGDAPVASDPGQGALDDPSFRKNFKALCPGFSAHDLEPPSACSCDGFRSFRTLISLIGENTFDERKSSPGATVQHRRRAVTVLNTGWVNDDPHHQSERIDEHMALDPFGLPARVKAGFPARTRPPLSRFHCPAVDDARRGRRLPAFRLAQRKVERLMKAVECAIVTPEVEILPDRAAWPKVLGQMAPLAAGLQKREHALQNLPDIYLAPPATTLRGRDMASGQGSLRVGQIARIPQTSPFVLRSTFLAPHPTPPSIAGVRDRIANDSNDARSCRTGS